MATSSSNFDVFQQAQASQQQQQQRFQPPAPVGKQPFDPPPPPPPPGQGGIKQDPMMGSGPMPADAPMTDLSRDNTIDDELGNYFGAPSGGGGGGFPGGEGNQPWWYDRRFAAKGGVHLLPRMESTCR